MAEKINHIGNFTSNIDNVIRGLHEIETQVDRDGLCRETIRKLTHLKEEVIVVIEGASLKELEKLRVEINATKNDNKILDAQAAALSKQNQELQQRNKGLEAKVRDLGAVKLGIDAW